MVGPFKLNKCKFCGTDKHLKSKWNSDTGDKWVHCDGCGQISKPELKPEDTVKDWNTVNPDLTITR